jgi:hypothetical protein
MAPQTQPSRFPDAADADGQYLAAVEIDLRPGIDAAGDQQPRHPKDRCDRRAPRHSGHDNRRVADQLAANGLRLSATWSMCGTHPLNPPCAGGFESGEAVGETGGLLHFFSAD